MSVDSYLELFTTLYGWMFYNIIWDVLISTGIVLIPFIGFAANNIFEAYRNHDSETGESLRYALRGIEVDTLLAFVVITLAGNPFFSFEASEVSYTPPAILINPAEPEVTAAHGTSSTYATISFAGRPNSVEVPVWWYGVQQLSAGVNRAIMEGVPSVLDYRAYMREMDFMKIKDPALREQVNDFYSQCFLPARSKYMREKPDTLAIQNYLSEHGQTDPDWMGSRVYLNTVGYYDSLRAQRLVAPFLYDPIRDVEWSVSAGDTLPTYGKPTCQQWWKGVVGVDGLKAQLIDDLSFFDKLMRRYDNTFVSDSRRQDVMLQKAFILDETLDVFTPRGHDLAYENRAWNLGGFPQMMETATKAVSSAAISTVIGAGFGMFIDLYLRTAPMLQAIVLMMLITLLPFLIVASSYRFSVLMGGAVLLFSVKFWTVLWFFAYWVDQSLILALFSDPGSKTIGGAILTRMYNGTERVLLNILTGMLYLFLPIIFSTVMATAGFRAGTALNGFSDTMASRLKQGVSSTGSLAKGLKK